MKLFVVGLDGATFRVLRPLMQKDRMPFFKTILAESTWGELESTYPPLTAPAWTSFLTGKTPGNHGIYDFFYRRPGSYAQSLNTIYQVEDRFIWDILEENGRTVGLINLPLTYPPKPVNGLMISGLLTPHGKRDFVYPPHLLGKIEAELGPYRLHHDQTGKPEKVIQQELELLEYRTAVALYLYKEQPADFFMVHFFGTDRIQHEFWHVLDRHHPQFSERAYDRYGEAIAGYYEKLDSALARIQASLDEETVFMVMSDHGFGPIHRFMNVNAWLRKQGFMRFRSRPGTWMKRMLFSLGFTYSNLAKFVLNVGFGKPAMRFGRARRQRLQEAVFLSLRDIDWGKTRAYSIGNFGQIFINLKGREPEGIVSESHYESICGEIAEGLLRLQDEATGSRVVERVFRRDELFQGDCMETAPDLYFLTKDLLVKPNGLTDFASGRVLEPVYGSTGHHRFKGILLVRHPQVVKMGRQIHGARIFDLTPTILYFLGAPIPSDMDGRVIMEMFRDDYTAAHPVRFSEGAGKSGSRRKSVYTEEEERRIRDVLKALGYV